MASYGKILVMLWWSTIASRLLEDGRTRLSEETQYQRDFDVGSGAPCKSYCETAAGHTVIGRTFHLGVRVCQYDNGM
jgi:hypothetical protein